MIDRSCGVFRSCLPVYNRSFMNFCSYFFILCRFLSIRYGCSSAVVHSWSIVLVVHLWWFIRGRLFCSRLSKNTSDVLVRDRASVVCFFGHAFLLMRPWSPVCIHLCSLSFVRGRRFVIICPIRSFVIVPLWSFVRGPLCVVACSWFVRSSSSVVVRFWLSARGLLCEVVCL